MAIPQSFIQELLARADEVEIVGRYVQLKKGGANFMGLCPFHGEKSPSFSVSPSKQFYHCFGCGKNGNAIGFLMEHAGMNFVEAVKDLAGQYAMQVPEEDASPQDRARAAQQREKQATLTDVLEKAGEAYRKHLKSSPRAIDYLKGRGLSGDIAKQFGLAYTQYMVMEDQKLIEKHARAAGLDITTEWATFRSSDVMNFTSGTYFLERRSSLVMNRSTPAVAAHAS